MDVTALPVQHGSQPQQPLVMLKTTACSSSCGHANSTETTFCDECGAANVQRPTSATLSSLPSRHSSLLAPHSGLVGRETELAQLHTIFERALCGERQIVFVSGEAGIGKTTLVDAFLARIRARVDVRITSGQCVEQYGPGEAYMPLLEATQRLCYGPGGERRIEALHRYAPSWLAQLPSLLTSEDHRLLQQRTQGAGRERMLREMAEAAELFTTRRGLVVVLEDLHWSDVSTLDWITYMARRREPAKLLILGTYRPIETSVNNHPLRGVAQELLAHRHCEELQVTPLQEAAIGEYLRGRFGEFALSEAVTATLARRSGGNPLFIVNMMEDLIRQGAVTEVNGQWVARQEKITEFAERVPDTVRQLIERQFERLPEAEQQLLRVASVAGVEFVAAEAAVGLLAEQDAIEATCERLARTGQWLRATAVAEWPDGTISGRYSFLHAVYHEVVYAQMTELRRVQLHRRIAEHKETAYGERVGEIAAELAVHFVKGRDNTKGVQYLQQAGKNAVQRSAHQEAVAHFTRGLELLATFPDSPERKQHELGLQVALGVPLLRTRGYAAPEVARAYGRGQELCQQVGEQPELFTALAGLCSFYLVRAELQTARRLAEQCLRLAQRVQDSALLVEAHFILGVTLFYSGELTAARMILERGRTFYDPQAHRSLTVVYGQDPGVGCGSYASLASWLLGYADQALGQSHDTLTLARELSHSFSIGAALHTASWLRQYRQETHAVQAHSEEEIALSKAEGFVLWLAAGTIQQGWALSEQGEQVQGLARMRQGMAALEATGAKLSQPYHLALLAQAHGKRGQPQEGLVLLDEALATIDKTGERYYEAEAYRLKGELTLQKEARDWRLGTSPSSPQAPSLQPLVPREATREAEECFLKAVALARQQQAKSLELRAATSLARLWQDQGKFGEARTLLEDIYGWFTEGFDTKDLQEAAALLRELGGSVKREGVRCEAEDEGMEERASRRTGDERLSTRAPERPSPQSFPAPASQSSVLNIQLLSSPAPRPQPLAPNLFRHEGDHWTLSFAGETRRLKDARGLHYIAHLLQHPHQEFHVLTLSGARADLREETCEASSAQSPGSPFHSTKVINNAMAILDPQVRTAYRQRLAELREELEEARDFHDLGQVERLQAELDALTHALANAVGFGEQARQGDSAAERARVNITRAIKLALRKISEHHPTLGHHLTTTLKTGLYCSYTPDTRLPITWQD